MEMQKRNINDEVITEMSQILFVAADETRLKILVSLLDGEKCVSDLEEDSGASQSLVSHQLQVLKKAKLVSFRKDGNRVFYSLDDEHIHELIRVAYDHVIEEKE
ncbi:Transcriptional repressor SmtB [bioreactor metagenome]|uniref:Transcriptional repressor SmtB n=1 Tax=bioreactor metagenome TaxID=1076179 RepID=A0A645IM17_9ZZZZ|nr:metalloregulator ArsR/SmtB family transcription factor [Erysipelotrichaceae bacterium]